MFVLLLVLVAVLFGLGFLHPVWWLAAAVVLIYAPARHGRDRGGSRGWSRRGRSDSADYREYRERRDREERWNRRYSRQNRARWRREDRRDRQRNRG